MKPEPTLVRRSRVLLFRMRVHERAVEIDHVEPRIRARRPCRGACRSASGGDPRERGRVDRFEGPPRGRNRRDLAEQVRLITQHREVRDRFAAIGEHHRQIDQHLTAIMTTAALLRRPHRHRQPLGQAERVSQIAQHASARVAHDVLAVTGHQKERTRRVTLHLGSALLGWGSAPSTSAVSPTRRAFSRTRTLQSADRY
jgi:hypothetical protein